MLFASAERSVVMEDPSVCWASVVYAGDNLRCRAASITPVGAWFLLLERLDDLGRGPSSNAPVNHALQWA
jgi:hypothetical protein